MRAQTDERQPGVPSGELFSRFFTHNSTKNLLKAKFRSQRACMYREAHCYKQVVVDAQVLDVFLLSFRFPTYLMYNNNTQL